MGSARNAGVFVREEDPDGVVRHARMLYLSRVETPPTSARLPATLPQSRLNGATVAFPSLALAGAMQTFDVDKGRVRAEQDLVKFDGDLDPPVRIPIDGFGRMAIRYAGPVNTYERVSFEDVAEGKVAAASFRNKVVLFGATTTGSEATDIRRTPRGEMPRVEITANALGSILGRTYLKRSRGGDVLATLVLVGIPAGLLLARRRPGAVVATGVVLALLYLAVAWAVVAFVDLLLPVTPVLVVIGVVTLLALAAERVFAAREAALPGGGGAL
jgi:CHASE2 domain-containing sensor protein